MKSLSWYDAKSFLEKVKELAPHLSDPIARKEFMDICERLVGDTDSYSSQLSQMEEKLTELNAECEDLRRELTTLSSMRDRECACAYDEDEEDDGATEDGCVTFPSTAPVRVHEGGLWVNAFAVLVRAVDEGVATGFRLAHEGNASPDDVALKQKIKDSVLNAITEVFDFRK